MSSGKGITRGNAIAAIAAGAALTPGERAEAQEIVNFKQLLKDVKLVDQYGKDFSLDELTTPFLAGFSFTTCEMACPRTFSALNNIRKDTDYKIPVVLFSVTPEKDGPKEMHARLSGNLKNSDGKAYGSNFTKQGGDKLHHWHDKGYVRFVTAKDPKDAGNLKKYMEFLVKAQQNNTTYEEAKPNTHSDQLYVVDSAGNHQKRKVNGKFEGRYFSADFFSNKDHVAASRSLEAFVNSLHNQGKSK